MRLLATVYVVEFASFSLRSIGALNPVNSPAGGSPQQRSFYFDLLVARMQTDRGCSRCAGGDESAESEVGFPFLVPVLGANENVRVHPSSQSRRFGVKLRGQ